MSVVSLHAHPGGSSAAAETARRVGDLLDNSARTGIDGSWEFHFDMPYVEAHSQVVAALDHVDPFWPAAVVVDYALAV